MTPKALWVFVGQAGIAIAGLVGIKLLTHVLAPSEFGRLARRTRNGSRLEKMLQYSLWLWRDLYNWTRVHYSLLGLHTSDGIELDQRGLVGSQVCSSSGPCQLTPTSGLGRTAQQRFGIGLRSIST